MYSSYDNTGPNIRAALPFADGDGYLNGAFTVSPLGAHPIVAGVSPFSAGEYIPFAGGIRPGATALASSNGQTVGGAWVQQVNGRVVWLGPLFAERLDNYANENLTDGSQAGSIALLARSIEWAGGWHQ